MKEKVLQKLNYNHYDVVIEYGFTALGQFEHEVHLRIIDMSWNTTVLLSKNVRKYANLHTQITFARASK